MARASVNEKGAFVVQKATKPVQDKVTKAWSYAGPNDGATTLSFAQATGSYEDPKTGKTKTYTYRESRFALLFKP